MRTTIKRYCPTRVHHIYFGYGYWWGEKVYFIGKGSTCFAIMPISYIVKDTTYASNGKIVGHGDCDSWSESRYMDNLKGKEK